MFKTSNPALKAFEGVDRLSGDSMTVNGTISKTGICLAILFVGALWSWQVMPSGAGSAWILMGSIGTFILG